LILLESFESWNLTQSGGYLQSDLSLSQTRTWNEFEFDFKNNDYALFIQNNWQENINIQLKWEESSSWKKIYINAIDESKSDNTIETLVNHIIFYGSNYIWENYTTLSPK
jgi:opacity protein-like surface antigen